ncbi:response regulator transcription factor [Caviibacter abscessus]|uniref:response regulator transcription factor n=1 Tax=Caviibacter abscessus TaxID=1766719 RepID=UPI000835A033|nr:response regulator transcription factor [Caviibacter abscessus]
MKILIYNKLTKLNTSLLDKLLITYVKDEIFNIHSEEKLYDHINNNDIDLLVIYTNYLIDIEKTIINIRKTDKNIYILAVDDMSDNFVSNKGIELGIDDYIFSKSTIKQIYQKISAVYKVITRYKYSKNNLIVYKDLRVDLDSYSVSRNNVDIELTKTEFLLLEYFLENKNKILTRTMIAEKLWDIDTVMNSNIVDVYVNFLRKKIDYKFKTKLITTVRGIGYIIK